VPRVDLFGYSKPAGEWFAYEWLAGVLFSMANSAAGLKGVTLMSAVLLSLVPAFLALHAVWRGAAGMLLVPLVLLGTNVLNIHFLARPHIFTLLLLTLTVWMVERDRQFASRRISILVPLMAAWANLHGGFLIVFPYLAILAAGCLLEGNPGGARRYAVLGGICLLATFANPYGWGLHWHAVSYLKTDWVIRFVDEFQSPKFRSEPMLSFLALLFLGLMLAGNLLKRKKYTEVMWILFFSYCALTSVRHATIWVVALIPLLAEELSRWFPAAHRMMPFELETMTVWPGILIAGLAFWPGVAYPRQFPPDLFPVAMVDKHRELLQSKRVFTTDQWADYLIWRNYPEQKVFMDARHNYFGPEISNEFLTYIHALPGWKRVQDKYRFEAVLTAPDTALMALLEDRPEWRILDRDGRAVLLVREAGAGSWGRVPADRSPSASLLQPGYRRQSDSGPHKSPLSAH
jgi:hypothetical protein